jgi:hypothetical protein
VDDTPSPEVVLEPSKKAGWISGIAWICAISLVLVAMYLGWNLRVVPGLAASAAPYIEDAPTSVPQSVVYDHQTTAAQLPDFKVSSSAEAILRRFSLITIIPNRPRQEAIDYTVTLGDSIFGIAHKFSITPESVLWSNYDLLRDNPHALSAGMTLKIPPTDGVYYLWEHEDTFEAVASKFDVDVDQIISWSGNHFDLTNPEVPEGSWVMIPGGQRELQQWIIPTIPRGAAGVSAGVYGSGACPGGYDGAFGTGGFIWPTINHTISGNDYWSGHLAIDIGAALGEAIMAADSGVIVFAGWATGGYGNMVMIDHGNGYQTLYAHLSSVSVSCGRSVNQGQLIGRGGSTGNSSGPHLHFEIRYQGGFVNPWYVLPAP